jgi:hypothetical protein
MSYVLEVCICGRVIETRKYFDARAHPPGEKREPKKKVTSEAQYEINRRKAERDLRRLMNTNFRDGDFLVRLDFFKEDRPDGSMMQEMVRKFLRRMREALKRIGQELKYIYVIEIGPRGGRHVHLMISRCELELIRKCWTHGGIHIDPLNSGGQYKKIAAYFIKYSERTRQTEGQLVGRRWNPSRNLKKPIIKKRRIGAKRYRENIRVPEGYVLDQESVVYGVADYSGYAYFSYSVIDIRRSG